jgi:protein-S-isoprenylcysteine O-methyltransferase Ste14
MTAYVLVFLVLGAFGAFHGLSAREAVRARLRMDPGTFAGLRALISFGLLVLSVVLLVRLAPTTRMLFQPLSGLNAILPALVAFWIAGMALRQVAKAGRLPQFFGFRDSPRIFVFTGAFTICRHPMYAGWLIASWGLLLSKPYLLTILYNTVLSAYVLFMARQEENRMIALFGEKYLAYRKQIPFILPYGFLKPQIRDEGAPRF